jgi:hypothetical protein
MVFSFWSNILIVVVNINSRESSVKSQYYSYIYFISSYFILDEEELDGRPVSALGVRSRKLSTGLNGQS